MAEFCGDAAESGGLAEVAEERGVSGGVGRRAVVGGGDESGEGLGDGGVGAVGGVWGECAGVFEGVVGDGEFVSAAVDEQVVDGYLVDEGPGYSAVIDDGADNGGGDGGVDAASGDDAQCCDERFSQGDIEGFQTQMAIEIGKRREALVVEMEGDGRGQARGGVTR